MNGFVGIGTFEKRIGVDKSEEELWADKRSHQPRDIINRKGLRSLSKGGGKPKRNIYFGTASYVKPRVL